MNPGPNTCAETLTHQVEPRRPSVTHRRHARGGTTARAQVHMRTPCGHQGIRHIGPHHRQAACFIGPHGCRLIYLGTSVLAPAPHSLCTAPRDPSCPCAKVVVHVSFELVSGLQMACTPSRGLLRLAAHISWCSGVRGGGSLKMGGSLKLYPDVS